MLGVEEFSIDTFTNRINAFKDSSLADGWDHIHIY